VLFFYKKLIILIDKIYCINLIRRKDRLVSIKDQFKKHSLNVEIFSALDMHDIKIEYPLKSGSLACSFSHYQIIQRAKICGMDNVLIFEDDAVLHNDFYSLLSDLLINYPSDFNILYLGGSNAEKPLHVNNHVSKCSKTFTTHVYIINKSMYDIVLSYMFECEYVIDEIYTKLQVDHNFYISNKSLAWQSAGFSDLEQRFMDYHWIKNI